MNLNRNWKNFLPIRTKMKIIKTVYNFGKILNTMFVKSMIIVTNAFICLFYQIISIVAQNMTSILKCFIL